MFSLLTPPVDTTVQGQVTIELRDACRDLITDLAVKMAGNPELLEALDALASAERALIDGPTLDMSAAMLQAHLHAMQDNVLEEIGDGEAFTLYLHKMTARTLAQRLERECDLITLQHGGVV